MLNWINKPRIFHDLTPVADRMSENMQRIFLQNAVLGLDALVQQVQINSYLQNTTHGIALTFAQYRSLLINAATGYDKQSDKLSSNGKPRRPVFNSETLFDYDSSIDNVIYDDGTPDFEYDMDTSPTELVL